MSSGLNPLRVDELLRRELADDLGLAGDLTSTALVREDRRATVEIRARRAGVIAGLPIAARAFTLLDPTVDVALLVEEGATVSAGTALVRITGNARAILAAERTALDCVGRLSGIATATRAMVDLVEGTGARIACTRKTTPGLRDLEKYAVRVGGGSNHRFGLFDAVLIKDNHVALLGGDVGGAVRQARQRVGHTVTIEIEIDHLGQLEPVLAAGLDVVLLDNMDPDQLRQAVAITAGRAVLEASGGITHETLRAIAETGVDVISVGALTHSAPNFDVGLDFVA